MRNASQVYIYVDVDKAIADGITFGLSSNGVVLTSGNEQGYISPEFFSKVVKQDGTILLEGAEATVDDVQRKTEGLVL